MPPAKQAKSAAGKLSNGDDRPEGLYAKIAYVMGQVHHVPKLGWNDHFKYEYVREIDLTEHLRPLLSELGLVILPSATGQMQIVGEGSKAVTNIFYEFIVADADSGDTVTVGAWGAGQDGQDKGPHKALTGALKYLLMKMFMVPTGDDPEATDGEGNPTDNGAARTQSRQQRRQEAPARQQAQSAEQEEDERPAKPAPAKKQAAAKKQVRQKEEEPAAPELSPEEEALLDEQIQTAQNTIASYIDTIEGDEELELEEAEQNNIVAAGELVLNKMPDKTRYLRGLTRAQEYLEKLLVDNGYELEE